MNMPQCTTLSTYSTKESEIFSRVNFLLSYVSTSTLPICTDKNQSAHNVMVNYFKTLTLKLGEKRPESLTTVIKVAA